MQLLVLIFSAMKIVLLKFKGRYCEGSGKSGYLSCRYIAVRIAKHLCMLLKVEGGKKVKQDIDGSREGSDCRRISAQR